MTLTPNQWGVITLVVVVAVLFAIAWLPASEQTTPPPPPLADPQPTSRPASPPQPSLPLLARVPRQQLDTERLDLTNAERTAIREQLEAMWSASPDENVRTDLPADPEPHEPA